MLAKILDFLPALAFFITYRMTEDLVMATGMIIACCVLSFSVQWLLWRKTSRMQIFMTVAVVAFGVPTVLLNDPEIIKWKITAIDLTLAILIFFSQYVFNRNPLGYLLGHEIPMPQHLWIKMGGAFMYYFLFVAALNVVIAFYLPAIFGIDEKFAESLWVDFKAFGSIILNISFSVLCIGYLMWRYPEMREAFNKAKEAENNAKEDELEVAAATDNESNK